jgi:hypothetical protein
MGHGELRADASIFGAVEGPKAGPIQVYAIKKDGTTSTYAEQ